MIVDSSAVLAIVFGEPGFEEFAKAIANDSAPKLSAASFVEVSIVAEQRESDRAVRHADFFFQSSGMVIEPVTVEQAMLARDGFSRFGKGRHPANLNFGDCFSYALAKAMGEPLLFKGDDFRHTDVEPAIP
jgi:ribonuclease VapC